MEWKKRGEECPGQQHARSPFLPCAAPFAVAVLEDGGDDCCCCFKNTGGEMSV